jgi:membrane-associated phospholipid phosphatase
VLAAAMVGIALIAISGTARAALYLPAGPFDPFTSHVSVTSMPGPVSGFERVTAPPLVSGSMFALISTASVATAYSLDHRVWQAVSDSTPSATRRTADIIARLGDLRYLGPALIAGYAFGRIASLPGASSASTRIGVSVLGAGAVSSVIKIATGRTRPDHSPGDSDDFSPFGGGDAFPSGHTTVAFAFASALDQETRSRWVPWVAYPAAAAVGWARIAQNRHWLSDVVAGAAIGTWTGREFDLRLQKRAHLPKGMSARPIFRVAPRHARIGLALRF